MPELPEVEAARCLVAEHTTGRKVVAVTCPDDTKILQGILGKDVENALVGRKITGANRKGKVLWIELDGKGPALVLHFGMTGSIIIEGVGALQYMSFAVDEEAWPPRFCKVEIELDGGLKMAYVDSRRFGKIWLQGHPLSCEPVSKLGFDPLLNMPGGEEFASLLGRRRGAIKAVLLDQSFSAGVGNWVADEVLYQARVHPEALVQELSPGQTAAVHAAVRDVVAVACAANADATKFPASWIFHHRWTGKKASKTAGGERIEFISVGGRTSAFVPHRQRKGEHKGKTTGGGGGEEEGPRDELEGRRPGGGEGGRAGSGGGRGDGGSRGGGGSGEGGGWGGGAQEEGGGRGTCPRPAVRPRAVRPSCRPRGQVGDSGGQHAPTPLRAAYAALPPLLPPPSPKPP